MSERTRRESQQRLSFFQKAAIESYRKEAMLICLNRGYGTDETTSYIHAIDWLLNELNVADGPVLSVVADLENECERMLKHSNSYMKVAIPIMKQALIDVENYICQEV